MNGSVIYHQELFDVMCIHMQDHFETEGQILTNSNWFKELKDTHDLRLTCTEGIPTSWNLNVHYPLVLQRPFLLDLIQI